MIGIFETQATFRKIVETMSYVGKIETLAIDEVADTPLPKGIHLLAATLLDQEVRFAGLGLTAEEATFITQEFRCQKALPKETDYYFCFLPRITSSELQACQELKIGNLIDPQFSATVFVLCDDLKNGEDSYRLRGPGIQGTKTVKLPTACAGLLEIRNQLNQEYPLGIDLLLTDEWGRLMSLPRTTQIEEVK